MYSDRRGGRTKITSDKTYQTQNSPDRNPRELRQTPCKDICMYTLHVLLKIKGVPRCMTYFRGGPRCVTMCDRGGESKLVQNSVTYFMDGPMKHLNFNGLLSCILTQVHVGNVWYVINNREK